MSSHVRSDNPRVHVQNRQTCNEKGWNIGVDGAIDDDASIRFPFLKTKPGFLQFPENQLLCCDSRLAVLVADPSVQVTVLRRWDVDDKSTNTAAEAYAASAEVESCGTASDAASGTTQEGGSSVITTHVHGTVVSSVPNFSSRSRDDRAETGARYKTTARVETSNRWQPEVSTRSQSTYDGQENVVRSSTPKTSTNLEPSFAESSKTSESRRTDASTPAGSTRVTTSLRWAPDTSTPLGLANTTAEETSESRSTNVSRPIGPCGTTDLNRSRSWAPVIFEPVDPPTRPTRMSTEENPEYLASGTPKATVPSGTAASTVSLSPTAETAKPTGPTVTTASKLAGPAGITTEETSRSRAPTEKTAEKTQGYVGCVDSEESLERALRSFVVYSSTVNFMASCPDDVLAMLEDDRIDLRSEWDAFRAANDWVLHDPVNRERHATKVMSGVRFSLMTMPQLLRAVHASRHLMHVQEYRDTILQAFVWRGACECGYSEHFLDFEPVPRAGDAGGRRCRCPDGPRGARGAEDCRCCCACRCRARGRLTVDVATEFTSRSP